MRITSRTAVTVSFLAPPLSLSLHFTASRTAGRHRGRVPAYRAGGHAVLLMLRVSFSRAPLLAR